MNNSIRDRLVALRDEVGYSNFWREVKSLSRERLENDTREKRKSISWSKTKSLYQKCKGVCWWCGETMPLIRGQIEGEHFDPNAENFNDDSNLSVTHKSCNREKGAMSLTDQALYFNITTTQLIDKFHGK